MSVKIVDLFEVVHVKDSKTPRTTLRNIFFYKFFKIAPCKKPRQGIMVRAIPCLLEYGKMLGHIQKPDHIPQKVSRFPDLLKLRLIVLLPVREMHRLAFKTLPQSRILPDILMWFKRFFKDPLRRFVFKRDKVSVIHHQHAFMRFI